MLAFVLYLPVVLGTTLYPMHSEDLDLNNYYYYSSAFNDTEIMNIQSFINNQSFKPATISHQTCPEKTKELRISEIQWIKDVHKSQWLYKKIMFLSKKANDAMYKFKLTHIKDSIQFTRYYGNRAGKYDWHMDLGQGDSVFRKLSIVVLLSDPSSFEGGTLQLRLGNLIINAPLNSKGSVVIFPSFMLHRVVPVTSGIRESLVAWISGYPFQ